MNQAKVINWKNVLVIVFAALCSAVSLELFLLPSNVVIGGALGVSCILDLLLSNGMDSALWYFSTGVWLVAINIPVLVYCFTHFSKRFALRTTLYVGVLATLLVVLRLTNVSQLLNNIIDANSPSDRVVYVIIGGALHGLSLPMVLSVSGSTGGSDIIGLVVQKNSKNGGKGIMRSVFLANVVIMACSSVVYGLFYDITTAVNMFIYSISALFICEVVQEAIFKGFSAALELEITTDKVDEMREALIAELKHGVTTIRVVGGYSRQEKNLVLCVISRRQLTHARKIIHRVDPEAFAYVENVREVIGKGFANKDESIDEDVVTA